MTIPLFSRDARRTDSYAEATVQISDYQITKEVDWAVCNSHQFLFVITQSTEAFNSDRMSLKNAQIDQKIRQQQVQTKIMFALENLVVGVADATNNSISLNPVMQPALDEVFHVRS
ncbi:hypothetical protein BV372_03150 [Nostoc sp. T09]|uniref:hypothetical protein n=1 Tax=Nostoc sp. T09 TaxID=1932621 RepID=UPI000A39A1C0|nr:hypothetical protein [Nostoc sp. T09]OUL37235.1 hypothetical protein BV372_03150 [Nostoc sp. T09]